MPENDGKTSTAVPWAPLLALLAAVAGVAALLPSPSARPPASSDGTGTNTADEISARLWQDPITVSKEALHDWQKSAAPEKPDPAYLLKAVAGLAYNGRPPLPRATGGNALTRAYEKLLNEVEVKDGEVKPGPAPVVLISAEPDSPYAEDVERRVRDRAAVLQALSAEGYLPDDSTTLHYATVKNMDPPGLGQDGRPAPDAGKESAEVLPYEVFHRLNRGRDTPPVLVVWLADGVLSKRGPLNQLAWIAEPLAKLAGNAGSRRLPDIRVLGPSTSEQYRMMLEDAADRSSSCPSLGNLAATKIFSCKASAPEEAFAAEVPWVGEFSKKPLDGQAVLSAPRSLTEAAFTGRLNASAGSEAPGIQLTRTICSDDVLAKVLWQELAARGVPAKADVAAIAELDSFYGCTNMASFLRSRPGSRLDGTPFDFENAGRASKGVHVYAYMAGLDGALPKSPAGLPEAKTKEADSAARTNASPHEPTEGSSQVDYLRRLAQELNQKNKKMTAQHKELCAVAVLGSDIYDKLQILRTLRPALTRAMFLTNNLDARFGHPDEWDETRNLLVAANYGLKPRKDWKDRHWKNEGRDLFKKRSLNECLPFRDSTQAAVYAATRLAFAAGEDHEKNKRLWGGRPLLFEIGRDGPVPLEHAPLPEPAVSPEPAHHHETYVLPHWVRSIPRRIFVHRNTTGYRVLKAVWCVALSALIALLLWGNPQTRTLAPGIQKPAGPLQHWIEEFMKAEGVWRQCLFSHSVMIPLALLASLACTSLWYNFQGTPKEPFGLGDGMSIWPGNFLRVAVLLLSGYFAVKIVYDLRKNAEEIESDLFIIDVAKDQPIVDPDKGFIGWWRNFWPQTETYYNATNDHIEVRRWWLRYKTWTNPVYRYARAFLLLTLYLWAIMCFIGLLDLPFDRLLPARGPTALQSSVLLWVSGLSAVFVTLLVVDATELNKRSIYDLNDARSDWWLKGASRRPADSELRNHWKLLEPQDCADYLDIEMIARRSEAVNKLVYYPFILLTLMIIGRWRWTDDYVWNMPFFIGLGSHLAIAVYCAIRLPFVAEKSRQKSLERLGRKLFERRVQEARGRKFIQSSVSALEQVIVEIQTMNRGAFVGIWEQPVLRAVLVPSGGAGLWALVSFLPH